MADGVYGSTFFMATGFHGIHVSIGALFLLYVAVNVFQGKLLYNHHFRFEAAA
jgi:heme/copper-type cytochrome/quinol oxidase subunit 3